MVWALVLPLPRGVPLAMAMTPHDATSIRKLWWDSESAEHAPFCHAFLIIGMGPQQNRARKGREVPLTPQTNTGIFEKACMFTGR